MNNPLPPRKILTSPAPQKARIKAFRLSAEYIFDQVRGYQGNAERFKIYGLAGDTIPNDAKLWGQGMWYEHVRGGGLYFVIEHPSFPEHEIGKGIIPEIPFTIGEREVQAVKEGDEETTPSPKRPGSLPSDAELGRMVRMFITGWAPNSPSSFTEMPQSE